MGYGEKPRFQPIGIVRVPEENTGEDFGEGTAQL